MTSSRSRRSRPTVALGSRVQVVEQAGPTQFLSHTSSAPAGMESTAEPARAAAKGNAKEELLFQADYHKCRPALERAGVIERGRRQVKDTRSAGSYERIL